MGDISNKTPYLLTELIHQRSSWTYTSLHMHNVCFLKPSSLITVDWFLVQGVDKVAWILYGVLEVADGV